MSPKQPDSARWQPSASLDTLRARACMLRALRDYFHQHEVLEVETPLVSETTAYDPGLASVTVDLAVDSKQRFLQTSPEFFMKRLLAAGSGSIFQMGKAFRASELGRLHSPEFSILEWYRVGFDLPALMQDVVGVVRCAQKALSSDVGIEFKTLSYREAFIAATDLDPFAVSTQRLSEYARSKGFVVDQVDAQNEGIIRDALFDFIMSHEVEPTLKGLVFINDYPPEQAALARTHCDTEGRWVASRFELYWDGVELANGYDELTDAKEQRQRFEADNHRRIELGLEPVPMDEALLAALESMPACSGVALGLDRLLMKCLGLKTLRDVLAF